MKNNKKTSEILATAKNAKDVAGQLKTVAPEYILRLFVSGMLHNSFIAIKNIKQICETYLKDNYDLEVIDIYQQPEIAVSEQILIIPVLIIKIPLPEKRLIGDLSDVQKVLEILNIN